MAGGHSIWASPEAKTDPKEIFNWRLWHMTMTLAFAGFAWGFDQGNIGGVLTLPTFRKALGIDSLSVEQQDHREGDLASMMAIGAAVGALLAAPFSDFVGRKRSIMIACPTFLLGAGLQESSNVSVFLGGRFISGLSIGAMSMLSPQFVAENSPKSIRGSLTVSYQLCVQAGLTMAFWVNYGVSLWPESQHTNAQWRLALGVQLIPSGIMFLMTWFLIDSPRSLIAKNRREQGLQNLCKLRKLDSDHPYLAQEYMEVCAQVDAEQELTQGSNYWVVAKDIVLIPSNLKRFFLAMSLFILHKLTGSDSINYFAPEIFRMIGVPEGSIALLDTGVYGLVKFFSTLVYVMFIIDRVGRKLPLMVGAFLQATVMLYVALYIKLADPDHGGGNEAGGIAGLVLLYIYAIGWCIGWSVAPYIVAAEIFPARIRSVSMSLCIFVSWVLDYGFTKATPLMFTHMGWGAFLFYSVLTYAGIVFVFFCMPETKGRSIESMDDLFQHSLLSMWRFAKPSEEDKVRHDVQDQIVHLAQKEGDGLEKVPEVSAAHAEKV